MIAFIKFKLLLNKLSKNKLNIVYLVIIIFSVGVVINHFRLQGKLIEAEKKAFLYEEANKSMSETIAELEKDFIRKNILLEKRLNMVTNYNNELNKKLENLKNVPKEQCLDSAIPDSVIKLLK